jgi:hypothetical protein
MALRHRTPHRLRRYRTPQRAPSSPAAARLRERDVRRRDVMIVGRHRHFRRQRIVRRQQRLQARDLREIFRLQQIAFAEDHGAEDRVLELADVARPIEIHQHLHRRGDAPRTLRPSSALKRATKRCTNVGQVFLALAQRRRFDGEYVEAIIEVFAEGVVGDELRQILVGRADDADIDLRRALAADRIDFAFLQHAQQFHLHVERQFADFVEEQRAAVRFNELASVVVRRAREAALHVAEQNGLNQVFRDRAAVHRHERTARALGSALDRTRQQFLADAAFAGDQHRNVGSRRALAHAHHRRHHRRVGDHVVKPI